LSSDYELDEDTLKEIAGLTHGIYFRASNPAELANVYQQLNKIEPRKGDEEVFRPRTPLYYWPLAMAFLLTIIMLLTALPRVRSSNNVQL
jgi:Ca-activated chloride channel family protein